MILLKSSKKDLQVSEAGPAHRAIWTWTRPFAILTRVSLGLVEQGEEALVFLNLVTRYLDHGPGGRQGRQVVYHVRLVKTIEKHESLLFYFRCVHPPSRPLSPYSRC